MGQVLRSRQSYPDRILCSPARRALSTAQILAKELGYDAQKIDIHESLYMTGVERMKQIILKLEPKWNKVFLVSHNPDITHLLNDLTGAALTHFPTCAMATVNFEVDEWGHITNGSGRLASFEYPKNYK